jgi:hypothetical protein
MKCFSKYFPVIVSIIAFKELEPPVVPGSATIAGCGLSPSGVSIVEGDVFEGDVKW